MSKSDELQGDCRLLFARLVSIHGSEKARKIWIAVAKPGRGAGKAASGHYNAVLAAMWDALQAEPSLSDEDLIRDHLPLLQTRLKLRSDRSLPTHLRRRWLVYRQNRTAAKERYEASVGRRPTTPIAGIMWDQVFASDKEHH